jgi:putative glutamine amidotransferase
VSASGAASERRPAIGITAGYSLAEEGVLTLREDYVRAVEKAWGLPLVLAPGRPDDAGEVLGRVRGLLLSGGDDVDPRLYGEHPHPTVTRVFPRLDAFEIALCRAACEQDLPVLAICRGQQVLNVAMGGTLVQDIPSQLKGVVQHDPEVERWQRVHEVRILPGTRLRNILERDSLLVNSSHHQAVREVGMGLSVAARSFEDDVIEAVEMPERRFVVGVQWHPEAFWDRDAGFHALFEAFVAASGS